MRLWSQGQQHEVLLLLRERRGLHFGSERLGTAREHGPTHVAGTYHASFLHLLLMYTLRCPHVILLTTTPIGVEDTYGLYYCTPCLAIQSRWSTSDSVEDICCVMVGICHSALQHGSRAISEKLAMMPVDGSEVPRGSDARDRKNVPARPDGVGSKFTA
jgi:hypothetical protein